MSDSEAVELADLVTVLEFENQLSALGEEVEVTINEADYNLLEDIYYNSGCAASSRALALLISYGGMVYNEPLLMPNEIGEFRSAETLADAPSGLKVFPNPTNSLLIVEVTEAVADGTIELVDVTGRIVLSEQLREGKVQYFINVEYLAAATYQLRLTDQSNRSYCSTTVMKQ